MYINNAGQLVCHSGVLGMHWGIRRYQPYPSDYHGDGKFVGKASYKQAKKDYKKAKKELRIAKEDVSDAKRSVGFAKAQLKGDKQLLKTSKKDYRHEKAVGDKASIKKKKQMVKDVASIVAKSENDLRIAKAWKRTKDKSLMDAVKDYDLAKTELKVQKALMKQLKKQNKSEIFKKDINEIKKLDSSKESNKYQTEADYQKKNSGSNSEISDNNRVKEAYSNAKNNDRYEMSFLEAVQNKTWAGANESGTSNKNKMLSEYKEYLQDRDAYWKNRSNA